MCLFRGVDADQREIEVTDDFIEISWAGSRCYRLHYESIRAAIYDARCGHVALKVRDHVPASGHSWIHVYWNTAHDAESFVEVAERLIDRATNRAVWRAKNGKPTVGARC